LEPKISAMEVFCILPEIEKELTSMESYSSSDTYITPSEKSPDDSIIELERAIGESPESVKNPIRFHEINQPSVRRGRRPPVQPRVLNILPHAAVVTRGINYT